MFCFSTIFFIIINIPCRFGDLSMGSFYRTQKRESENICQDIFADGEMEEGLQTKQQNFSAGHIRR